MEIIDGAWKHKIKPSGWHTLVCPFCGEEALVDACDMKIRYDFCGNYFVKRLQTKHCPNCGKWLNKTYDIA